MINKEAESPYIYRTWCPKKRTTSIKGRLLEFTLCFCNL